jgi:hypothetical protein
MSIKIKRFHANESDFKMTQRNRTEVNILSDIGFTDLTSSRAIADMHIDVLQGTTTVLLPATFGNQEMVGAQALIKNTRVVSQQFGLLNERRNQNVIDANCDWYVKSRAQEDAESLTGSSTTSNYGFDRLSGLPDSPFISYSRPAVKETGVIELSATRRAEIPIAWKHLDSFASIDSFPNIALGNLTYNVEFEDQIQVVSPANMPSRAGVACDSGEGSVQYPLIPTPTVAAGFWRAPKVGDLVTAYYTEVSGGTYTAWDPVLIEASLGHSPEITSVTVVNGKYNILLSQPLPKHGGASSMATIFMFYSSQNEQFEVNNQLPVPIAQPIVGASNVGSAAHPLVFVPNSCGGLVQNNGTGITGTDVAFGTCPWYVGAPVTLFVYDDIAHPVTTRVETTIEVLTIAANGNLEVVLSDTIAVTVGAQTPCLAFRDSYANSKFTVNWNIDEFYLELFKINLTGSQMAVAQKALENLEIPYTDQLLVQKNMQTTNVHTETINCPPNTIGCSLLSPDNLTLLSHFDGLSNYRWSLNGREVTNQAIIVGGSNSGRQIHNIMLKSHFGNLGLAVKKYDASNVCYVTSQDMVHTLIPLVIPNVPAETLVQVTLVANGNPMQSKNLFFVFHVSKMLKISKGMVKIM